MTKSHTSSFQKDGVRDSSQASKMVGVWSEIGWEDDGYTSSMVTRLVWDTVSNEGVQ